MIIFYLIIFIISCVALAICGKWLVDILIKMAKFLGWREFVVAFFVMSFATSLPNLFVGITSALRGIPELSFGDVIGGNVFDLTIVVALSALLFKGLPADSKIIQTSSLFTIFIAILPLLLVADKNLSRIDGLILISAFLLYTFWLFSKEERFTKIYDGEKIHHSLRTLLRDVILLILIFFVILLATQGIISSAVFFAGVLKFPLILVGILIVGLGNALPETYFSIISAKKGESWMILGNLMGSVVVPATLILGIVALIQPISISELSSTAIARIFLIISALFFLFFVRSDRRISKKEALFLLTIYFLFILIEILVK